MLDLSIDHFIPWIVATLTLVADSGFRIILLIIVAYLAARSVRFGISRLTILLLRRSEVKDDDPPGALEKRVNTSTGLIKTISITLIWAITIVMALAQVGLDITPILASAGVIGVAVAFGAQNLVRDIIGGFFLVLENQVRVGDVAIVNGTGGLVEAITFRTITLRDLAGVVHVFPNGTINTLSNMTKGWSAYVIDVGVAYKEDTDQVVAVMKEVGDELQRDSDYSPKILEPIEIFGVDGFGESEVVVKARLKTIPIEQWTVGREYRRRLKKAFDSAGIEIPFPHRTLYMGEASGPFQFQNQGAVISTN